MSGDPIVVAHAGDLSTPSGGSNRVSAFAAGLADAGHAVTVVAPAPEDALPDRLSGVDVETVPVDTGRFANQPVRAAMISRRAKRLAERRDGVFQFEHSTLGGVGALLGCEDFVLDMHDLAFPSPFYAERPLGSVLQRAVRAIETRAVRNASHIIVVSERMRELVREEWDVPADRFSVIPNGYFEDTVAGYSGREPEETRVAFLGTLHPKLDVQAFVDVARLPTVDEVAVVGHGAKREMLEERKTELGLDALRIHGRLPDDRAFEILGGAAVAINPQRRSPLQEASSPVKLFYYAALGLPMVVTEGPDAVDELAAAGAAEAVPEGGAFAEQVAALVDDPERRERMSANARRVAEGWTWDERVADLVEFYGTHS